MDAVPPRSYPREKGSPVLDLPIESEGPAPFYPPVCLRSHWNPTAIFQRSMPDGKVSLPLDPRPWAKICMEQTTTGENQPAPAVNPNVVLPSGGQFYPPTRYQESIDRESQLRRLDRPLGTDRPQGTGICDPDPYTPSETGDMFNSRILIERKRTPSSAMIEEIAFPRVLMNLGPYDCRAQQDQANLARSPLLFHNATKQDRYKQLKPNPSSVVPGS